MFEVTLEGRVDSTRQDEQTNRAVRTDREAQP